jgi:hypothetical protein
VKRLLLTVMIVGSDLAAMLGLIVRRTPRR